MTSWNILFLGSFFYDRPSTALVQQSGNHDPQEGGALASYNVLIFLEYRVPMGIEPLFKERKCLL